MQQSLTSRNKRSIEDHFDKAYELETELELRNKHKLLPLAQGILPPHVSCLYIRQAEALGLGHAVLCAQPAIGNEPFAVILADDLIDSEPGALAQMVKLYEQQPTSILGVENVPREATSSYGIVETSMQNEGVQRITGIVEKPHPSIAPSTLAVVGRYILTPGVFDRLRHLKPGVGGEIQLTDGIAALMKEEAVLALPLQGIRYDCGSKLGYLQATVKFGLKHPETHQAFSAFLAENLQ
ncbi:UTP--glucose-1-phosphate uridylyltransferase [Chromobacterium rhizoryzae]|uniref:UTP--glucose-1-phosphate uridylyltransferase n=1 Tax=Chromobacterium rhizoryzae TaxID=1778675 RepID=A0AAD0RUA5_9NEIS|nr:UTP--glucose-1-phosphate uridylyltransferase [Chromobacterium rhizoryzae]